MDTEVFTRSGRPSPNVRRGETNTERTYLATKHAKWQAENKVDGHAGGQEHDDERNGERRKQESAQQDGEG